MLLYPNKQVDATTFAAAKLTYACLLKARIGCQQRETSQPARSAWTSYRPTAPLLCEVYGRCLRTFSRPQFADNDRELR